MKKSFLLLLVVSLFGIVGCGSDDGDEAVEGRTKNFFLEDSLVDSTYNGDVESCARYVRKYSDALKAKEKFDRLDEDAFDLSDLSDLVVFYYDGSRDPGSLGKLSYLLDLDDQYGLVRQTARSGFINVFGLLEDDSFSNLVSQTGYGDGRTADEVDEFLHGIDLLAAEVGIKDFSELYAMTQPWARYELLEKYNLLGVLGINDVSDLLDLRKIFDAVELSDRTIDRYGESWSSVVGEQSRKQGSEVTESQLAEMLKIQAFGKLLRIHDEMNNDGLLDDLVTIGGFKDRVKLFEIVGNLAFLETMGMVDYPTLSQNLGMMDCNVSARTDEVDSGIPATQAYNVTTGVPTCEDFPSQQAAQSWFDFNAFEDFDRSSLDPFNTQVACSHGGSPWPRGSEPVPCAEGERRYDKAAEKAWRDGRSSFRYSSSEQSETSSINVETLLYVQDGELKGEEISDQFTDICVDGLWINEGDWWKSKNPNMP